MNNKLTSFYVAYHSWVKSGAWENGLFSTAAGLCVNAYDYFALIGADSDEPLKEMHAAFVIAGLDEALPFNESMEHYEAEKERCECHLNPARVAWVERQVAPQFAGLHFATPDALAAAISVVRCYDELSTELIAEEIFKNGGAVC